MNQKLWSSLAAALLMIALGTTASCHAETTKANGEKSQAKDLAASGKPSPEANTQPANALKVGEYQSQSESETDEQMMAKIHSHDVEGRQAATVYLRDIPVLTFLGTNGVTTSSIKVSKQGTDEQVAANPEQVKSGQQVGDSSQSKTDPVSQAAAVAAKLNQLRRDNVDANTITVSWGGGGDTTSKTVGSLKAGEPAPTNGFQLPFFNASDKSPSNQQDAVLTQSEGKGADTKAPTQPNNERYLIKVNGEKLVEINAQTRLPDTTNILAEDALQITNRLRRLFGNAAPLTDIPGKPAPIRSVQIALNPIVTASFKGWASWYGPGFHGNLSASGERYNQNALTAAHRTLPFGTRVRVTNLKNGLSVVVRINDRGPFIRGRIIDLSAASARLLGMMNSGVAPVSVEVLGNPKIPNIQHK